MLPVRVDLDQHVVAVPLGHAEPDPHGATHPEREHVGDDLGAGLPGLGHGAIGRGIVDHEHGRFGQRPRAPP